MRGFVGLIAALAFLAPSSSCAQAPGAPMTTERLMAHVGALAHDSMQGRRAGTEGAAMARDYIAAVIGEMGFDAVEDTFEVRRRNDEPGVGVNLLVEVEGTEFTDRYLVLTAHYDHVGVRDGEVFNGADDNASGTAALLELAGVLREAPLRHSVLIAFLDAEEGGLQGARHLVGDLPVPLEAVLVNVNLDMVGHSDGELWATGTAQYPALRPLIEAIDPAPPVFLRFGHDTPADTGADNWVSASDHAAFHAQGVPFVYFGVADHPDYHRSTDDPETLNPVFLSSATETIRRVVEAFDGAFGGRRPGG